MLRYDAFPFQRFGQHRGMVERVGRSVWSAGEKVGPVTVREPDSVGGTGVTPWVQAGGGVTLGVELRHVTLLAFSELGFVIAGAAVELEGARLQRVRGTAGTFGLQAGWLW